MNEYKDPTDSKNTPDEATASDHGGLLRKVLDWICASVEMTDVTLVAGDHPGIGQALLDSGAIAHIPDRDNPARRLAPTFQFTPDLVGVRVEVVAVNHILDASRSPLVAASWWATPHAQLGGVAPWQAIDQTPTAVLAVAQADTTIDN